MQQITNFNEEERAIKVFEAPNTNTTGMSLQKKWKSVKILERTEKVNEPIIETETRI